MSTSASLSGAAYSRTADGDLLSEQIVPLDQGHEPWARDRDDRCAGVERAHEVGVAPAGDRGFRREEADPAVPGREDRGVRLWREHADDGDREPTLKVRQRSGGRRVARGDDELDTLLLEIARDLARESANLVERPRPVGEARAVPQIHEVLVRKRHEALVQDREAAHARVEDADGARVHPRDSRSHLGSRYPSAPW